MRLTEEEYIEKIKEQDKEIKKYLIMNNEKNLVIKQLKEKIDSMGDQSKKIKQLNQRLGELLNE